MISTHGTATIDLSAIAFNTELIKNKVKGAQVMGLVKADGYGHGLVQSARAAQAGGATWLATATMTEAIALREAGVNGPLLCWLYTPHDAFMESISRDIDLSVSSVAAVEAISRAAYNVIRRARVHIKVDTGMGRNGVRMDELPALVEALKHHSENIEVIGIMSHLASADDLADSQTAEQLENFRLAIEIVEAAGIEIQLRHIANSVGALGIPETHFDLVRPGISLYGVSPSADLGSGQDIGLKPTMIMRATISNVKAVTEGSPVSYSHQYVTSEDTNLALIPLGYSNGIPRNASNQGPVVVAGNRLKISGRVCMDQFVIDIGKLTATAGDEVVLFGDPSKGHPTVAEWAAICETIPHEIFTRLGPQVHREYINVPF